MDNNKRDEIIVFLADIQDLSFFKLISLEEVGQIDEILKNVNRRVIHYSTDEYKQIEKQFRELQEFIEQRNNLSTSISVYGDIGLDIYSYDFLDLLVIHENSDDTQSSILFYYSKEWGISLFCSF